jgi:UDP-galactopyranose mutase
MTFDGAKILIVGAGLSGIVIAERIVSDLNEDVVIIDKRDHIGGNCYSEIDEITGIEYHRYGSHIFHTALENVWHYLNRFTAFTDYRHTVLTTYKNKVYQMPVNLFTINNFYNLNLKPYEVEEFINSEIKKETLYNIDNLETKAISLIGRPLYEAFIKGYTIKQWQTDPIKLPADIITRLPVRENYNYHYFNDPWQGMPVRGYSEIFRQILKNEKIHLKLNIDYFDIQNKLSPACLVIYTGPIDRLFDYKFGKLSWRTLKFEKEIKNVTDFQGTSVMNYAEESIPYTRIHEFKHLHPERTCKENKTILYREYSLGVNDIYDEPYYPVNSSEDKQKLSLYLEESTKNPLMVTAGRLGRYKYLDMDKAIAEALQLFEEVIKPQIRNMS